MKGEAALYPAPEANLANKDVFTDAMAYAGDDHALESLDPAVISFHNFGVYLYGISGPKFGNRVTSRTDPLADHTRIT